MSSISSKLADKMRKFQRQSPVKPRMEKYLPAKPNNITEFECIDKSKVNDPDRIISVEMDVEEVEQQQEELEFSRKRTNDKKMQQAEDGQQSESLIDKNRKIAAMNKDSEKKKEKEQEDDEQGTPTKKKKLDELENPEEQENLKVDEDEGTTDNEEDSSANQKSKDVDEDEPIVITNIMSKTFTINLTKEVKDYVRDLAEKAHTAKPPTVSKLKMITSEALKQLLKYNDRPVYNELSKHELAGMVLEYMKIGCPPRCPKCKRGALRFSNGTKKNGKRYFWCPGSTKDGIHFLNCKFVAQRDELERIPWKTPP